MNKDLDELHIIRLQTEIENCIGFREHYLNHAQKTGNNVMFIYYDTLLSELLEEVIRMGEIQ